MTDYKTYENDSLHIDPHSPFFADHVSRYWWAHKFTADGEVLDCACGKGYGSFVLSQAARQVTGVDLNQGSLDIAQQLFQRDNLQFQIADVTKLADLGRKFDVITAFEVIEHLPPEITDAFLLSLKAALKPGGVLLLSTPNHDVVLKSKVEVPDFHINNFPAVELRQRLKKFFPQVEMLGQYRRRSGLNQFVFDFDFFNLRHLLPKKKSSSAGTVVSQKNAADFKALEYFSARPAYQDDYVFSGWHWRQAGLTVAVCS